MSRRIIEYPLVFDDVDESVRRGRMENCYIRLPLDLKKAEADRVCAMIQCLVFPETIEEQSS